MASSAVHRLAQPKIIPVKPEYCLEILKSFSAQKNLTISPTNTKYHSFSVYSNTAQREMCRLVLPINYPRINNETNFIDYYNNLQSSLQLNPYLIFLLGKGASALGYSKVRELKSHSTPNDVSKMSHQLLFDCVIQVSNSNKQLIKLPNANKAAKISTDNLTVYYSQLGHRIRKFNRNLVINGKMDIFSNPSLNIGYIAERRYWKQFWSANEKRDTQIPFSQSDDRLIHIGGTADGLWDGSMRIRTDIGISFPRKRDLVRCAHLTTNLTCIVNDELWNHTDLPLEVLQYAAENSVEIGHLPTERYNREPLTEEEIQKLKSERNLYKRGRGPRLPRSGDGFFRDFFNPTDNPTKEKKFVKKPTRTHMV